MSSSDDSSNDGAVEKALARRQESGAAGLDFMAMITERTSCIVDLTVSHT